MLRSLFAILALWGVLSPPVAAEEAPRSECLAMSQATPRVTPLFELDLVIE